VHSHKDMNLSMLICWGIWINMNKTIFMDATINWETSCTMMMAIFNLILDDPISKTPWVIVIELIDSILP